MGSGNLLFLVLIILLFELATNDYLQVAERVKDTECTL